MTATERHRIKLLEWLSNPDNPFPQRQEYAKILNVTLKTVYQNFTPADLQEIENEAFEIRKKNSTRQRVALYGVLYNEGMQGNITAIKDYLDRTEGKVPDKQQHSGPGGGPISHSVTVKYVDVKHAGN